MSDSLQRLRHRIADDVGECCEKDVERRLSELDSLGASTPEDLGRDLQALKTLGDGTRHRLARLLVAADGELCVCELVPVVDVSESAVSHALSDLVDAGLAARRKDGTWRYYRPTPRAVSLVDALDATREASR